MFARHPVTLAGPIPVSAAVLALAVSLAAVPAHGFDLKLSWQDGMKAATADLEALGEEDPAGEKKSRGQVSVDREIDRLAGKTAGKIERGMWKVGEKAWKRLEETKTLGPTLKKLGKRWGPAARTGVRLSPHVGTALTVWDFGYAVGDKLIAPKVVSAIERKFENDWKRQEEALRRDVEHNRRLGERRREGEETVSNMWAVGLAMKKLREDKRGPWAETDDPWGEGGGGANAAAPGARNDPWAAETPDIRTRRPVAVEAAEAEAGPANYERALNALQGESPQSAGYEKALEKLETDRRAERERRDAEAEATRRRHAARAAEERRQQAARDQAARQDAAARERETQQALERAARERREYSKRSYDNSLQQLNRNMQMLRQTRQQQQRAYQLQKARQQQLQLQQRLEQARRQRIYVPPKIKHGLWRCRNGRLVRMGTDDPC